MNSQSTNIIPIQYIPPSKSDDGIAHTASSPQAGSQSQAARTLDEARQNLLRPRQTPPQRPARTPDLHLRLSPPHGRDSPQDLRSPGAVPAGQIRDSYLSANSSTPSFLSGNSYDIHTDAPKIVTSKQVHVGRLQQAEVVQLGQKELFGGQTKLSPIPPAQYDPSTGAQNHLLPSAAVGPYCPSPSPSAAYAMPIVRSLTPGSRTSHVEDAEEGLVSEEPMAAGPTDLRFSMGSLAYERNSVSTMETSKFFARPDSSFALTPPRPQHQHQHQQQYEQRESMFSTKSYADSFLGGFPMIPPLQPGAAVPALPASALPQSTSVSTLDHHATVGRPPAAFRPLTSVRPGTSGSVITRPGTAPCRPITATSTTDSFLGTFPFVQPNVDDLAELPSAGMPETAVSKGGIAPRSVSTTSEGLGGFDFSFGDAPPLPSRGVVPATPAA